MLVRRLVQFANICGSMLLFFTLATMGLFLLMIAILRHSR